MLLVNEGKPARERLTLIRVFEELRGLGYEGGYVFGPALCQGLACRARRGDGRSLCAAELCSRVRPISSTGRTRSC